MIWVLWYFRGIRFRGILILVLRPLGAYARNLKKNPPVEKEDLDGHNLNVSPTVEAERNRKWYQKNIRVSL
jgi:hypothetical protein